MSDLQSKDAGYNSFDFSNSISFQNCKPEKEPFYLKYASQETNTFIETFKARDKHNLMLVDYKFLYLNFIFCNSNFIIFLRIFVSRFKSKQKIKNTDALDLLTRIDNRYLIKFYEYFYDTSGCFCTLSNFEVN